MHKIVLYSLIFIAGGATALSPLPTIAQTSTEVVSSQPPDYTKADDWVCRPDKEGICTSHLDTKVLYPDGSSRLESFVPAQDPSVDCFYVYPTVSTEASDYADLTDDSSIQTVTNAQAGRLTSKCRVFAPLYRQATLQCIRDGCATNPSAEKPYPKEDILKAWIYYLDHYNRDRSRGVVLIGHSQGTLLLQWLMKTIIDENPDDRKILVAAFLAGDPSLAVLPGAESGVTFKNIPVCSAASQVGCVYVWGSYYGASHTSPTFGGPPKELLAVSACRNPSAPEDGTGALKFYYANPDGTPGFTEALGQVTGRCQRVEGEPRANTFDITLLDGPNAKAVGGVIAKKSLGPKAGLHELDIALVQGNILDVLDAEIATWQHVHHGR